MATITELRKHPRTTPGIKTRRALHDFSTRGHNSTENANSGPRDSSTSGVAGREPAGASPSLGALTNDRPIRSAHPDDDSRFGAFDSLPYALPISIVLWCALGVIGYLVAR